MYIWSKMLTSSLDKLFKLTKTTSSQKLFDYDCMTLYHIFGFLAFFMGLSVYIFSVEVDMVPETIQIHYNNTIIEITFISLLLYVRMYCALLMDYI